MHINSFVVCVLFSLSVRQSIAIDSSPVLAVLYLVRTTTWWQWRDMALANVQLKPPELFDFKQPDNWTRWKRRFEQFRVASGLADKPEPRQVSTLLYCLGEEADDVLTSTNISAEDRKKYSEVIAKFDAFFQVRKNVIFERARFNRRNQRPGESIEQYITALYGLLKSCEFGTFKEELLRDRIVVRILDTTLSDRM